MILYKNNRNFLVTNRLVFQNFEKPDWLTQQRIDAEREAQKQAKIDAELRAQQQADREELDRQLAEIEKKGGKDAKTVASFRKTEKTKRLGKIKRNRTRGKAEQQTKLAKRSPGKKVKKPGKNATNAEWLAYMDSISDRGIQDKFNKQHREGMDKKELAKLNKKAQQAKKDADSAEAHEAEQAELAKQGRSLDDITPKRAKMTVAQSLDPNYKYDPDAKTEEDAITRIHREHGEDQKRKAPREKAKIAKLNVEIEKEKQARQKLFAKLEEAKQKGERPSGQVVRDLRKTNRKLKELYAKRGGVGRPEKLARR